MTFLLSAFPNTSHCVAMSEVPLGLPKQGMGVGGSLRQHESLAVSGAILG